VCAAHCEDLTVNPAAQDLAKTILELETRRIAAMVRRDVATLDALLADDLSYTHSGGRTDTKASFVAFIREKGDYVAVDFLSREVVPIPGGTAVVARGRAEIRLEDTPPYQVLFLDVWALRDGAWKMVAWQATRLP
jgi:ketosteroid isomerase-like protein